MARDRTEVEFLRPYLVQHMGCTETEFTRLVQQWEAGNESSFLRFLVTVQLIEPALARTVEVVRKGYATIELAPLFSRSKSTGSGASITPAPLRELAATPAPASDPTPAPRPAAKPIPEPKPTPAVRPIPEPKPTPVAKSTPGLKPVSAAKSPPGLKPVSAAKSAPGLKPVPSPAPQSLPTPALSSEESASWPASLLSDKPLRPESPAATEANAAARPRPDGSRSSKVRGVTTHDPAPRAAGAELTPLSEHTKIGRFTLQEKLGEGATAVIFRAFHQMLGIPVAVKLFRARLSDDYFDPRALVEAKLLARIDHPNIVRVLDADVFEGRPYIVFEYMRAPNLQTTVSQQGRQSASQVAMLGMKIADALRTAHEQGLIHRDVKPENILLRSDGQLKLTDFGFATLGAVDGSSLKEQIIGTPNYMSPEQAADPAHVDLRSDMYSLGATLYFAATGRPPFERPTPLETIQAQINDFPLAIHTVNLEFNLVLSQVILRLLSKKPADRYAVWEEVQLAFREILLSEDPQALGMSGMGPNASSSTRMLVGAMPSSRTGPGRSSRKSNRHSFSSDRHKLTSAAFVSGVQTEALSGSMIPEEPAVKPRRRLPIPILFYLAAVGFLVVYLIFRLFRNS